MLGAGGGRSRGWRRLATWAVQGLMLGAALAVLPGASCMRSEAPTQEGTRLRDLTFAPGTKQYTNQLPEPVRPAGAKPPQSIPLAQKQPVEEGPPGPPGVEILNPQQREKYEARKYLYTQPGPGRLVCTALDPATRRPLMALIRVVAADKTVECMSDPVTGSAVFDLPAGKTQVYCTAGEFFSPYTNEIDVQAGENRLEVLLTQVPELAPGRYGFSTLALAASARQDHRMAERRMRAGQADFAFVLSGRGGEPAVGAAGTPVAVDGPFSAGTETGSRFAGLGAGPAPRLEARLMQDGAEPAASAGGAGFAAPWDDLYRLKQAGFLRVWLYPEGLATRPELVQALKLPARQFAGSEGFLAAERGPGLELVTLGAQGEGEAVYFALLNRGLPVAAIAEPAEADRPGSTGQGWADSSARIGGSSAPTTANGAGGPAGGSGESYQSLPAEMYDAVVTPRTLVQVEGLMAATPAQPFGAGTDLPTMLAWLKAGQVQVAYGPVIRWKMREFKNAAGYAAQPVPAADRMYHLDVSAFIGPGAPPEYRSIQLIELVRNGLVVAALPVDRPLQTVRDLVFEIRETASCWYMLRAYSGAPRENQEDRSKRGDAAQATGARGHWRRSWSAPIHFAAAGDLEARAEAGSALPVAVRAFGAVDDLPLAAAEVVVTRGGFLVSKTLLKGGAGTVEARVGDHILVGAKDREWRETAVSPYENLTGDPWRAIDAEPAPVAGGLAEDARAANARLSGLGLLCPLVRRAGEKREDGK